MKKYLLNITLLAAILSFAACDSSTSEDPIYPPTFNTNGVYIINEGTNGANSTLSYYNPETKEVAADVFFEQNKIPLGDGAQDMLIYGSKMYTTVTTSNNVYITDLEAKMLKYSDGTPTKISSADGLDSPRSVIAHNGNVYVSYYSGHVAKIDTTSMRIVDKISADYNYFEEMTTIGSKLYVAEGRDPQNRIAIVDLGNFRFDTPIEVPTNPMRITSDKLGNLFVLSTTWNEHFEATTTFTQIKAGGERKEWIVNASEMAVLDNKVLFIYRDWANSTSKFTYYDIYAEEMKNTSFITIPDSNTEEGKEIGKHLSMIHSISINLVSKEIYLSTTDYTTEGLSQMFIFTATGKYTTHFKTGGIAPKKAKFIIDRN